MVQERRQLSMRGLGRLVFALLLAQPLQWADAQVLKISSTLTIDKTDDKVKTHEAVGSLIAYAKEKKLAQNVLRFLENTVQQTTRMLEAAEIVAEQKLTEVPKEFTSSKYKVKSMPKLQVKKNTVKKISATDLQKKLESGGDSLSFFKEPVLVTNTTALFESGEWDNVRRHWSATRIAEDTHLEQNMRVEYWAPDKARARLVGNMFQMEEPELLPFSRYLVVCFHGTPAKPKLPGQNTEHCEQSLAAQNMIHNASELKALDIFPQIQNALQPQAEFRERLLQAGSSELDTILGKGAARWKKRQGSVHHQHFTFGPSGSGDKLHAENGLPFYDILIHGSRRWLLLKEDEMERVAEKAREALEFDKTSAYMFFEDKLPELRDEFGLKKYVECNQNPGDLVYVPSGWFRVSLSLADSISYYQTILSEPNVLKNVVDSNVWRPNARQYQLAYCYAADELDEMEGLQKGGQVHTWLQGAIGKVTMEEALPGILNVLFQCGAVNSLKKSMPSFGNIKHACTKDVWKRCRKRLVTKLEEKGVKASLDWLPKQAPESLDDIKIAAKEEL